MSHFDVCITNSIWGLWFFVSKHYSYCDVRPIRIFSFGIFFSCVCYQFYRSRRQVERQPPSFQLTQPMPYNPPTSVNQIDVSATMGAGETDVHLQDDNDDLPPSYKPVSHSSTPRVDPGCESEYYTVYY